MAIYFPVCGIAGILRVHPPGAPPPPPQVAIADSWLDTLDDSIKHRGPDGQGRFRDRAVRPDGSVIDIALIHRRLAIIDPACGHQPMVWDQTTGLWPPQRAYQRAQSVSAGSNTPTTPQNPLAHTQASHDANLIAVVFNGCIYNHRELRKELQAGGHLFETDHSDTEVLVHGWRAWREHVFSRLTAMFALAIWDRATASLILARDQFGEKPLMYTSHPDGNGGWTNVFASTFAGPARIAAALGGPDALRVRGIDRWVRFGFGNSAPVECASPVTQGYAGILDGPAWRHHGFGSLKADNPLLIHERREPLPIDLAERLLERAVESKLDADVPLGCFLSGGIDSSLVAAIAKRKLGRLSTFTVRMPDPAYDESAFAQTAADAIGTAHHTLDCAPQPATDLVGLIQQLGLPLGDSSLLPAHWVSRAAHNHVKVALSGDGGDELFLGYERYWAADQMLRARWLQGFPSHILPARNPKGRLAKLARMLDAVQGAGYLDLVSIYPSVAMRSVLGRPEETDLPRWARVGGNMAAIWDVMNYLPDDLLRKTDTASMSCALEVRCPLLDPQLAVACLSAPLHDLIPRHQRKGLLRQVARRYLPPEIVDRPKQGFAIPISDWFRTDYGGLKTLLLDHLHSAEPWGPPSLGIDLNMNFVRQMLDEHMNSKRDHGQRLYMLLVLSIWARWLGKL